MFLWGNSICIPLETIFKKALLIGVFPSEWKKGNIVHIHKNSDKPKVKNYRLYYLLPICDKIFERHTFNEMFNFLSANKLIFENQSRFQPGDSFINQLLSVTHEIFTSFDNGLEVRIISCTCIKLLIKSGTKGLFLNWNKTAFLVNYFASYLIVEAIGMLSNNAN